MENQVAKFEFSEVEKMATACAQSQLFGVKTKEQALALMLLAQAEGRHPMICAKEYHIIQGRPALKSDAMLSRFQNANGKIEWIERNDKKCSAKFSHPNGGELVVEWTIERARAAELTGKDNWKKYPCQMLSARVISEGVRAVYPAVLDGMYTPEEVKDFDDKQVQGSHEVQHKKTENPVQESKQEEKKEPSKELFSLDIGPDKAMTVGRYKGMLYKDMPLKYLVWLIEKVTTPENVIAILKPRLAREWTDQIQRIKMTDEMISYVISKVAEGKDTFSELTIQQQYEAVEFLKKEPGVNNG